MTTRKLRELELEAKHMQRMVASFGDNCTKAINERDNLIAELIARNKRLESDNMMLADKIIRLKRESNKLEIRV